MRSIIFTTLGAAMLMAACTGSGYEAQTEGDRPARVTGMLFVERAEGGGEQGVQVGARFLRVVGVADDALPDLVGAPVRPRVGTCVDHGVTAADPMRSEVRLLDVGPIDVLVDGQALRLTPRRFPDLWNVVSGVLYGTDTTLPLGTWRFATTGGDGTEVGAFEVYGQSPEAPTGVRVGLHALPFVAGTALPIPHRGTLTVQWNRAVPSDDRVAIVFEGNGSLVCGARDEGAFTLDAAFVERAADILRNGGSVSVHRLRTRPFAAQGLDAATLVFDLSVRARARVE